MKKFLIKLLIKILASFGGLKIEFEDPPKEKKGDKKCEQNGGFNSDNQSSPSF